MEKETKGDERNKRSRAVEIDLDTINALFKVHTDNKSTLNFLKFEYRCSVCVSREPRPCHERDKRYKIFLLGTVHYGNNYDRI